jgi:cobalt/nickel transport system permease protein
MHLPAESLQGAICPVTAAVAAGTVAAATYILTKSENRPTTLRFALTTMAVFALQTLNYALPGGYSGHMLGAVFATAMLGAPAAVLALTTVITVQCLAFADGGTAQLGANVLNMAVVAVVASAIIRKSLAGLGSGVATFSAAAFSVLAAVAAIAIELAIGVHAGAEDVTIALFRLHLPIALAEGAATVLLVKVSELRLEKVEWKPDYALVAIVVLALFVMPFVSSRPDALETVLGL